MQSSSRPAYLPWVDAIRILAIFFVIVVHVSYQLVFKWGEIPFDWWMVGNIVDGASRTAVSLFFMVSGYLNLTHPMPWNEYFKKRIPRVLILLVTWSLLHKAILSGTVYDHLWFMYSLFGFYLITPVFQKIVESEHKLIWYFLGLWVFFEPFAALIERFAGLKFGVFLPQATGYFGFYLLGYLLGIREFTKKQSWLAFGTYILATLFIVFSTWALTISAGKADTTFYYINGFPVLIGAIGLFIFIKYFNFNHPLIRFFGATTTGIFLMHYIIIDIVKRGIVGPKLTAFNPNPYIGVPLTVVVVFLLSAFITWVMLKIPILRRIVS
jgi:surface polysaccharide O-acyltransferase-like enzyme